jgi:hypothetical protein
MIDQKEAEAALAHFCVNEDGRLARCEKCGGLLYAPFLKGKFGEIEADGQHECVVCLRRELFALWSEDSGILERLRKQLTEAHRKQVSAENLADRLMTALRDCAARDCSCRDDRTGDVGMCARCVAGRALS